MTIIGFDVSKAELVGCRIDRRGQQKETFRIPNELAAIQQWLTERKEQYSHLLVGCEATAEYHLALVRQCLDDTIPFRLLNPIVTKQYTRATVRKRKTDPSDALAVARLVAQGEGSLMHADDLAPAKSLMRSSVQVRRLAQAMHLMQKRAEDLFSEDCPEFAQTLDESLHTLIQTTESLYQLAHDRTDIPARELLCSVPGIGQKIATILVTEIGDVSRFHTGKHLVAFAGLDPKVRQSGTTLSRNTRLTKRGSPYLRRALFIAASIAVRHDPELREYYEKKRAEGKPYRTSIVAVARKLTYRLYAVWKRGTPFTAVER